MQKKQIYSIFEKLGFEILSQPNLGYIIKINPEHSKSRYELINIYQLLNRPREAKKECDILYMLDRELYYSARFCNK